MKDRPNIILIILDTLRKDTFESNLKELTNIGLLAKQSTHFLNATSPAPWTVPAHASILTGLYPREHKMVSQYDDEAFFKSISLLPERTQALQERLQSLGYNTSMVSANPLVGDGTAFSSGYDYSETMGPYRVNEMFGNAKDDLLGVPRHNVLRGGGNFGMSNAEFVRKFGVVKTARFAWILLNEKRKLKQMNFPAEKGAKEVLHRLGSRSFKEPFFLFVNLMEMHEPYCSVDDFGNIARTFLMGSLSNHLEGLERYREQLLSLRSELKRNLLVVDEFVGNLIRILKANGSFDRTAIVMTSDHGQSLGEDQYVGHTYLLNDAIVNMPLIIKTPGGGHATEGSFVSTLGIYDFLIHGAEGGMWKYPVPHYIFSEAFGFHRSGWKTYAGSLSDQYRPEIRKRIWGQQGYSLTANGSRGVIEQFNLNGKNVNPSAYKAKVKELLSELEMFVGNSGFKVPSEF